MGNEDSVMDKNIEPTVNSVGSIRYNMTVP